MRSGVLGHQGIFRDDVVVEEDDQGVGRFRRAEVAGCGCPRVLLLQEPKPVGNLERANHVCATVAASVQYNNRLESAGRVGLPREAFEYTSQAILAVVRGYDDGEGGRFGLHDR